MRSILATYIICLVFICNCFSQELNCNVVVNAQLTGNENFPIFKTLEKQLSEFITNTKWTDVEFDLQERIDCNMIINITAFNNNLFNATLQVQSSRPVYGASYTSPVYNFNDEDFSFRYLEYQTLNYNPIQFQSNLISVISFHIYMILGVDADTFSKEGGTTYYKQAQIIANYSQQETSAKGWRLEDGLQSRFSLIDNILSPTFKPYRDAMYEYHRKGLDVMSGNVRAGKENILKSLEHFELLNKRRPNSFLLRTFFDAKAEEIEQVFSGGPSVDVVALKDLLTRVAPLHSNKWRNIKY